MSSHADALAQAKSLEDVSDDNLVHYFKTELIGIGKGGRANDLLPDSVVQRFLVMGLLKRKISNELTDKAWDIIQEGS